MRKSWRSKPVAVALAVLLVFGGMFAAGQTARANTTTLGSTGLFMAPSADVTSPGGLRLAYHLVGRESTLSFNLGMVPGLELNAAALLSNYADRETAVVGAKVRLLAETRSQPALALGGDVWLDRGGDLYLVVSKAIPQINGRLHLGLRAGQDQGLFAGFSYLLNPVTFSTRASWTPRTVIMVDLDRDMLNAGVRLDLTRNLWVDAGLANLQYPIVGAGLQTSF
ncbi:MAG: hypothetical protein IMW99_01715 [Firmicutes bacterium]|nr:hypothetical protein [Bacillota bacterium]